MLCHGARSPSWRCRALIQSHEQQRMRGEMGSGRAGFEKASVYHQKVVSFGSDKYVIPLLQPGHAARAL